MGKKGKGKSHTIEEQQALLEQVAQYPEDVLSRIFNIGDTGKGFNLYLKFDKKLGEKYLIISLFRIIQSQ